MAICVSSGKVIVHALDEKAREYYNLEDLWTTEISQKEPDQVISGFVNFLRPISFGRFVPMKGQAF